MFDAVDVLHDRLDALELGGADVVDASIDALESWLDERFDPESASDPVASAVDVLRREPGTRIASLVDDSGLTHQAFIERFRALAGLPPKQYAQVARFSAFVSALRFGEDAPPWSRLAAESEYYDQPEIVRAFRRFSGWTPTEYARRLADYGPAEVNFVPTAEP